MAAPEQSDFGARLDHLHSLLREVTVSSLQDCALTDGFKAVPSPPSQENAPLFSPWMSLILVYSEPLRVTLTTHFKIRDAGVLASVALATSPARVIDSDAVDFMKEYTNLAGGRLKKCLQDAKIMTGMSLPLIMRGFDYIYMGSADEQMRFSHQWQINGVVSLRCAAMIDILNKSDFSKTELQLSTAAHGVVDVL